HNPWCGFVFYVSRLFGLHRRAFSFLLDGCTYLLCRDGRDDFFLLLRFLLVQLLFFLWLLLCDTAVRRNIFDIDHVAYLDAWMKLELACGAIDVELDLPLANVDVRPCGLEERPPKYERRLPSLSHIENHKVNGD